MKSKLERALVHLLHGEREKADELMHEFVIESARNIHETLREGDEINFDDIGNEDEQFFGQEDLDDEKDEASEELADDMDMDMDMDAAEVEGEDLADDTLGDMDAEEEEAPADDESLEVKIDEIEDELADLTAKFEEMMAAMDAEDEGDDVADEAAVEEEVPMDDGAEDFGADDFSAEEDNGDEEEAVKESEDEDFDDITEAVIDELKKATVPNTDARFATGGAARGDAQPSTVRATSSKPKPNPSRGGGHTGFDREGAPASKPMKKADWNARDRAALEAKPKAGSAKLAAKPADGNKSTFVPNKKK